jgi:Lar family restriction alleviation protein
MQISNCPFCGGDGKLVHIPPTNSVQSDEYYVECGDCGSRGRACDDSARAMYYWNHREFQQETFQQAVINDPDMTYEQKKYWLSQKPPNTGLQADGALCSCLHPGQLTEDFICQKCGLPFLRPAAKA